MPFVAYFSIAMETHGRKIILSPVEVINKENIVEVINALMPLIMTYQTEVEYLFDYHKGIQPILQRQKVYHTEINNKIVENHAREITAFKVGYLLWKPIEFVARKEESDDENITYLNDCMVLENSVKKNKLVAKYQSICGTAYKLALQNKNFTNDNDESPFKFYAVHPKNAVVVYSSDYKNEAVLGILIDTVMNEANEPTTRVQAYTKDMFYEIVGNTLKTSTSHTFGYVPLVEYPLNDERMGDFEQVIPLLDAINTTMSNRVDGIEQFIQAIMIFKNLDISDEAIKKLRELGGIKIKDINEKFPADIKYLTQELNQEQTQTLVDYMYNIVLKIVGMPSQSDGTNSDSSNNGAVILKNGWQGADARASETEVMFQASEREFLKVVFKITRELTKNKFKLRLFDLDIKFTRRNYENLWQKAQTLDLLLKNDKIAPRLAFLVCGLFTDSEQAYIESKAYYDEIVANGVIDDDKS